MLGFLFGFNARLGRLHYFLASFALGVVMIAIVVAIAAQALASNKSPSFAQLAWPLIGLAVIFVAASLSLQCMRIRDIGWDPVLVMPTWIAICIVDHLVASRIPSLAVDVAHSGTVVGGLLNIGMVLALWFWPGADNVGSPPSFDSSAWEPDPPPRAVSESMAAPPVARPAIREFGRRSG
jgi:uncharacterized membrane protein YhaH (DUF805 family)